MKKLLLVLFIAGFVGLAFAYSPARISNDYTQNEITSLEDTTKTIKKTKTTKDCPKKACCKMKCSKSKAKKKTK
jgi:hypothetical protein